MTDLVDEEYCRAELIIGKYTGKYVGIRQREPSGDSASAYLKPVEADTEAIAVWVNPKKLDEVLNFIRTIGAYGSD